MKPTAKIMPLGGSSNSFSKMRKLKLPPVTIVILILFAVTLIPIVIGLLKQNNISSRPKAANCETNQCKTPDNNGDCVGVGFQYEENNVSYRCMGNNNTWFPPLPVATTKPPVTLSNIEIAGKVLIWLDQMKSPDGHYYLNLYSSPSQGQVLGAVDKRISLYVIWARLAYWKKTGDQAVLSQLEADLDTLLDNVKTPRLQPDMWSCRISADIWQEANIPQATKDKAKAVCQKAKPKDAKTILSKLDQTRTFDPGQSQSRINTIDTNNPIPDTAANPNNDEINSWNEARFEFDSSAVGISDNAGKYLMDNNPDNLQLAKLLFTYITDDYESKRALRSVLDKNNPDKCLWGMSAADLYQATKENQYLGFSQNLLDKEISGPLSAGKSSLFSKTICSLSASELYKVSPDAKYQNFETSLLQNMIADHFDSTNNYFFTNNGDNIEAEIRTNALLVKILSE